MAMLAEPRRRQKLSFDPRNKAWTEDSTKYGQKLMEKMGWSKGKGLGVKEDGTVSHVKVSLKNNNLGIGCKVSQEDNWIAHQDDFNDLLSTLNEGRTPSTSNDREALSLEERSKKSRSRVHYKKFTRGKDMSQYGEEGMNSILGRRLTSSAPVTPQTQSVENSDEDESEEKEELTHGVVTFKGTCSVGDYFAQKMSAFKRGRQTRVSESHSDTELEAPRCGFGFRQSMEQGQRSDVEGAAGPSGMLDGGNEDGGNEGEEEEQEMESEEGPDGVRSRNKKKKKRKKKKARSAGRDSDEENEEQIEVRGESDIEEDEGIDLGRKKKKNKKKKRLVDESKSESASEHNNENGDKKKKKKTKKSKKDKNRHLETPGCSHDDDDTAENSEERSSGETSKRKRDSSEEGLEEERAETSSGKKKRKKSSREDDVENGEAPSTSAKKKKKKKHKV